MSTDFTKLPGGLSVRQFHVGRWTLAFGWQYEGDLYGYRESDGWSLRITFIRNPRAIR